MFNEGEARGYTHLKKFLCLRHNLQSMLIYIVFSVYKYRGEFYDVELCISKSLVSKYVVYRRKYVRYFKNLTENVN